MTQINEIRDLFRVLQAHPGVNCLCNTKPMPRWDVHFGDLEDDRKDSMAPHITFSPQLMATDSVV